MGFQDRKKHDNVEKEKVHLLSLEVPFSFDRKVSVHATLYDKKNGRIPLSWPSRPIGRPPHDPEDRP